MKVIATRRKATTALADSKGAGDKDNKKGVQFPLDVEGDDALSIEDIDLAINEEDPEFANQVSQIAKDKDLSFSQIDISAADQALIEERERWEKAPRPVRMIYKIFPFVARISLLFRRLKNKIFSLLKWIKDSLKKAIVYIFTEGRRNAGAKIKGGLQKVTGSLSKFSSYFKYLPWPTKLLFFGTICLAIFTGIFIFRSMTTGVIKIDDALFLPSLEQVADSATAYNPDTETESLYDNLRVSNNLLLITKMVVNLKKSENSGSNPMGAFEFFVEGSSAEVVIEVKDREVEIRDRMQRTLEELTFDQVDTAAGKEFMLERLKKEINALLTTGKIKKVLIKTAIAKP